MLEGRLLLQKIHKMKEQESPQHKIQVIEKIIDPTRLKTESLFGRIYPTGSLAIQVI